MELRAPDTQIPPTKKMGSHLETECYIESLASIDSICFNLSQYSSIINYQKDRNGKGCKGNLLFGEKHQVQNLP
jgi:hypothetical protein